MSGSLLWGDRTAKLLVEEVSSKVLGIVDNNIFVMMGIQKEMVRTVCVAGQG